MRQVTLGQVEQFGWPPGKQKIGGKAGAMIVCSGIERAIAKPGSDHGLLRGC